MFIYEKISKLCKKENITIKELELKLGLSNGIIGKWKNSSPNVKYLLAIADYFGVDINELCYEIDKKEDQNLLSNFHHSDERGKKTIITVAELEASRSRKERISKDERAASAEQPIQFADFASKAKKNQDDEQDELKPFA